MRKPKRFIRFSSPEALSDGQHFAIVVETEDGAKLDLEIPLTEVGAIIEFLVSVASHINPDAPNRKAPWSPIPVHGLGLAPGRSPAETLLVVRFGGFDLAFSLDSTKVKALSHDFSRTALALSASDKLSH
jgi:hypothetical protein